MFLTKYWPNSESRSKKITSLKARIVAPSGKVDREKLESGLSYLKAKGFEIKCPPEVFGEYDYFSGDDKTRLKSLQEAINDAGIEIVWAARGGYGVGPIIDKLDWAQFQDNPKTLIGFSDISLLHLELSNRGFLSIHGPMVQSISAPYEDARIDLIKGIVIKKEYRFEWESGGVEAEVEGKVTGGNLSLVVSSIGTQSEPDWGRFILFLEEVNEPFHKVDRMLDHLKRRGVFEKIKGLILGDFSTGDYEAFDLESLIGNKIGSEDFPLALRFPAGHVKKNVPIPFGMKLRFRSGKRASLGSFE